MSLKQDAYNASLAYGQFQNFTQLIILVIVGTGFFVGAYYTYKWYANYVSTKGTIVSIDNPGNRCDASSDAKGNLTYSCLFTVSYNYKGYSGTTQLQKTSSMPLAVGEKINLVYVADAPSYPPTLPQASPWYFIVLAVIGTICYLAAYYDYKMATNKALEPVLATRGAVSIGTDVGQGIGSMIRAL
jgi:hypothetical protein